MGAAQAAPIFINPSSSSWENGGRRQTEFVHAGTEGTHGLMSLDFRNRRIDVHHHIVPPTYAAAAGARLLAQSPGMDFVLEWTPEKSLAEMHQHGVETAITSLSTPAVFAGDVAAARILARECNEFAAGMARDFPRQFGFFATLPLPDVDGSLVEIAYALDVLKADGVGFLTSYGDKWLGDAAFATIFDELHRRNALVYVHPTVSDCCRSLLPGVGPAVVEFLFDTTRTITSLLFSGTFSRCSGIRFVFSHAGGALPMLAPRIAASAGRFVGDRLPNGALYELKRLYFDLATTTHEIGLDAILKLVAPDHVLLGTDYPFMPMTATLPGLDASGLPLDVQAAINRLSAAALVPRFA
jgi:6-methylsalicylate decarboxylase